MKTLGNILACSLALTLASGAAIAADDYPSRPIQLIAPYGAGGLTDTVARRVAEKMGKILGQPIVVVNKAGGATAIGTGLVAASEPDGYTMLINMTGGFVVTPLIVPNLPYRMKDLKPVGKIATANYLVVANKDLPVRNLAELVAYAKKNPNTLTYASPGIGTVNHLAMEELNVEHRLGMQHVPYNSELQVMNALIGEQVHVAAVTIPSSLKFIEAGRAKGLAVLAEQRASALAELGTSAEQGFPDMVASLYNILFVPAKTPAPVVRKLENALKKTLEDEEIVERLNKMQLTIDFVNSAETEKFLEREAEKWAAAVRKTRLANN